MRTAKVAQKYRSGLYDSSSDDDDYEFGNHSILADTESDEELDKFPVPKRIFKARHATDVSVLTNAVSTFNIDDDEATADNNEEATRNSSTNNFIEDDDSCNSTDFCWKRNSTNSEYTVHSRTGISMPNFKIPASLFKTLYKHQKEGIAWMVGLHNEKIGGLLGDDMGMGKTYQALALLGGLMRARTIRNALVVAPVSVLRSWENEARKVVTLCVPNIHIQVISSAIPSNKRVPYLQKALKCSSAYPHLIITSYSLIGSSHLDFVDDTSPWDYIVLDEAQQIKNASAQRSKYIRRVARPEKTRRLMMTGTPIMNNMKELWALFDFAAAGRLLGGYNRFNIRFQKPIEDARSKDASKYEIAAGEKANEALQKILRPFLLQRLKCDYLADKLPTKSDYVIWTHLSPVQRRMYADYVASKDSAVASVLSGKMTSPLEAITWLKMLCGHPILVDKEKDHDFVVGSTEPEDLKALSSKLQVLDALIEQLRKNGHRILIFSQSTKMLDIIQRVLTRIKGIRRIDGKTKERERQQFVDEFNSERNGIQVMLLSTKAAGIGLTLTGADRAIIYDPSWNPAEDSQAIDRCYRIGQTKAVTVFRFIAAGTVEEKMYEKQVFKDGIRRTALTSMGNDTARYFDKYDLRQLFKLNEAGKCDFLDRLRTRGLISGSGRKGFLSVDVVGTSSHDILYTEKTVEREVGAEADEHSDSQKNPFASPAKASSAVSLYNSSEMQQFKVLGKSQKALQKKKVDKKSAAERHNTKNPQGNAQQHPFASPTKAPSVITLYTPSEARDPPEAKAEAHNSGQRKSLSREHTKHTKSPHHDDSKEKSKMGNMSRKDHVQGTSSVSGQHNASKREHGKLVINSHRKGSKEIAKKGSPQGYVQSMMAMSRMEEVHGSPEEALRTLMDLLEDKYHPLSKGQKLEIHNRMATISYRLQWL